MFILSSVLVLVSSIPGSDCWPSFRGNGTSISLADGLPVRWSVNDGIAWRVIVPGYGQSSPLIWKDRVFLTSVEGANKEKAIISAFNLCAGKMLWKKEYPSSQRLRSTPMVSRAAPTGVVDAERLIALFESGDLICLDHQGNEFWKRALTSEYGPWDNNHGMASSLAQDNERVFVLADHRGSSPWLMAIHKATGRTVWKVDRKPKSCWTSPIIATIQNRQQLIISSSGCIEAYSPENGKSLWKLDGLVGNTIASPVAAGDRIIVGAGETRMNPDTAASAQSNCAISVGASGPRREWGTQKAISQHASPLVYRGVVYFMTRAGMVHAHDLETGKELFVERLTDPCWATPIAAGEWVYFFGKGGATTVFKAGTVPVRETVNRLWGEAEFARRKEEEKAKSESLLRTSGRQEKAITDRRESAFNESTGVDTSKSKVGESKRGSSTVAGGSEKKAGHEAVGDVVYGVAAVDGMWIIRTGTELFCIRHGVQR